MEPITLICSPLSVNDAWQGRRFKTDDYLQFEKDVSRLLPYTVKNSAFEGLVQITYRFHLKYHKTTDYDNLLKPLQDVLVKNGVLKDDRFIYRAIIEKVPFESNWIEVLITPYTLSEGV